MKIDLNKWTVISKPKVATKKNDSRWLQVSLQRTKSADYLVFKIGALAAKQSHIAVWDRVSVALSKDNKFVTLFKNAEGTHKVTCAKASELEGQCVGGYIKLTVRDDQILKAFEFFDDTTPSELSKYEVGDGFITCYASRKVTKLLNSVFSEVDKKQQAV